MLAFIGRGQEGAEGWPYVFAADQTQTPHSHTRELTTLTDTQELISAHPLFRQMPPSYPPPPSQRSSSDSRALQSIMLTISCSLEVRLQQLFDFLAGD